jgi:hypothetical protein
MQSSASFFEGRGGRSDYFFAQVKSENSSPQANIPSIQRNEIQEHRFCAKQAVSLLWEVRKLLMLLITSGVGSAFASMCPDCSTSVYGAR